MKASHEFNEGTSLLSSVQVAKTEKGSQKLPLVRKSSESIPLVSAVKNIRKVGTNTLRDV